MTTNRGLGPWPGARPCRSPVAGGPALCVAYQKSLNRRGWPVARSAWASSMAASILPAAGIAGQAEDVIDAVASHQRISPPGQKPRRPARTIFTGPPLANLGRERSTAPPRPPRRCSRAASWRTEMLAAEHVQRQVTVAASSRGRSGPPGGRAADRRWHRDPARSAPAAAWRLEEESTNRLHRPRLVADLVVAVARRLGACSSRFSVLLPATAQPPRCGSSPPTTSRAPHRGAAGRGR